MLWTELLEKTLESSLDCKEIKPGYPKGNQPWIFFGRTDAEAEALILWPPNVNSQLIWKDSDAGKDWRWQEKGTTDNEMVGSHHKLNGHSLNKWETVKDREAWCVVYGVAKNWIPLSHWITARRNLSRKIRDTKGTFHAIMGMIKDSNGNDPTEPEEIKKRWQENTEVYKKVLMTLITTMVWSPTWRETDILGCKSSGSEEASLPNKLVEVIEFQLSYFKS